MATPHIEAKENEIAKVVLMSGDPLRAKYIAENFLEDVKCFNHVRNMFGYTGFYKGKRISVMGSGMGMPSIGIYSYELYKFYKVDTIIRIGSAGSYIKDLKVLDVFLASKAYSESNFAYVQNKSEEHINYPDSYLNEVIKKCAKDLNISLAEGCVHSSDVFYQESSEAYWEHLYEEYGCAAVEMESFALFHNAKVLNKKAACLLTISDSFVSEENISSKGRETSFTDMMKIALETAYKIME